MALYIVATPIGNLEDITLRALRVLREVDFILAEDTRRTNKLLSYYKIKNKIESFNDFNKERKTPYAINLLKDGKNIAIVSDSGTPGISDPGFYLVRECVKNNVKIAPIPGASSVVSALVASGLATNRFSFFGFLPKKESKKRKFLENIGENDETIVLFESPYRLIKTLELMNKVIPYFRIVVAREMTKKFEEFVRGSVIDVCGLLKNKQIKGEIVIILNKSSERE